MKEAGSSNDNTGYATTSQLQLISVSASSLNTSVQPAFWLAPGWSVNWLHMRFRLQIVFVAHASLFSRWARAQSRTHLPRGHQHRAGVVVHHEQVLDLGLRCISPCVALSRYYYYHDCFDTTYIWLLIMIASVYVPFDEVCDSRIWIFVFIDYNYSTLAPDPNGRANAGVLCVIIASISWYLFHSFQYMPGLIPDALKIF